MTRNEKLEYIKALREQLIRESRTNLLRFTLATMPNFEPNEFHKKYYSKLTEFAHGQIKKLMIFMPPQHGKSEGSTRRLPAFILGRNPNTKIAVVSYNAPRARKFNREIQRVIDCPEYKDIFPGVLLNEKNITTLAGGWLRNADECEIVGYRGGFKTVGVGGSLTGEPVDIFIMDDLYKDAASAWSPVIRGAISEWYDTTGETRLHNDSQQLMVFTRWHEDDLAGTLLRQQGYYHPTNNPNGWDVVIYKAIKEGVATEDDKRNEGEPLWPEKHSLDKLLMVRNRNPHVFESLYQQNPSPSEGYLYTDFETYETLPPTFGAGNYTDTADSGDDYLCSVCYEKGKDKIYITDVLFTQEPMEVTENLVPMLLTRNNTRYANVESNGGGRYFAVKIKTKLPRVKVDWFYRSKNKESRILTNAATVNETIVMPLDWRERWPIFARHLIGYKRLYQANKHHDGADVLTGIVEKEFFGKTGKLKRMG